MGKHAYTARLLRYVKGAPDPSLRDAQLRWIPMDIAIGRWLRSTSCMPNTATDSRKAWRDNLGLRLKEERERIGRSQTDVARHVNATKQLISHWETGRSEISVYDLYSLSLLGVDTAYVLHGKGADAGVLNTQPANVVELQAENAKLRALLADALLKAALRD